MLPGFSDETKPLTDMEKELLPLIIRGLSTYIGSANAISNKEIGEKLFEKYKVNVSEARLRKIINHIRTNALLPGLVANGCGYYITHNLTELRKYDESLAGRESAIHILRKKLKEYINELELNQQTKFF